MNAAQHVCVTVSSLERRFMQLTLRGIVTSFVTLLASSSVGAAPLFSDIIDTNGGWVVNGGGFTSGVGGLPPSAGSSYWGSTFNQPADVALSKTFPAYTVQPGTYTVSI